MIKRILYDNRVWVQDTFITFLSDFLVKSLLLTNILSAIQIKIDSSEAKKFTYIKHILHVMFDARNYKQSQIHCTVTKGCMHKFRFLKMIHWNNVVTYFWFHHCSHHHDRTLKLLWFQTGKEKTNIFREENQSVMP